MPGGLYNTNFNSNFNQDLINRYKK
jgi:hypothetical protein